MAQLETSGKREREGEREKNSFRYMELQSTKFILIGQDRGSDTSRSESQTAKVGLLGDRVVQKVTSLRIY